MKLSFSAKLLGGFLIATALGAFALTQIHVSHPHTIPPGAGPDRHPPPLGAMIDPVAWLDARNSLVAAVTPAAPAFERLASAPAAGLTAAGRGRPAPISTPGAHQVFLPEMIKQLPKPSETPTKPEPPAVSPTPGWPDGLASRTASKLGLHVVRNNDPYIMEYVRRARPRVMKSVDDLGWLSDVKLASPNTITIGRISGQNENWPEELAPDAAAREFIDTK